MPSRVSRPLYLGANLCVNLRLPAAAPAPPGSWWAPPDGRPTPELLSENLPSTKIWGCRVKCEKHRDYTFTRSYLGTFVQVATFIQSMPLSSEPAFILLILNLICHFHWEGSLDPPTKTSNSFFLEYSLQYVITHQLTSVSMKTQAMFYWLTGNVVRASQMHVD